MGMVAMYTPVDEDAHFTKASLMGVKKGRTSVRLASDFQDVLNSAFEGEESIDIDKAWDMLHRCLNEGKLEPLRSTLEAKAIYGDAHIEGTGEATFLLTQDNVTTVSRALADFNDSEIEKHLSQLNADDDVYCMSGDGDEDYVLQGLNRLRRFYKKASDDGKAVVIVII